jgi:hypothetical protein
VKSYNIDINSPILAIQSDLAVDKTGTAIKVSIKATTPIVKIDQAEFDAVILKALNSDKPVLRGAKAPFQIGIQSLNDLLKMQNTPIMDCDLVDDKGVEQKDQVITGTDDSNLAYLKELSSKVGNYEKF